MSGRILLAPVVLLALLLPSGARAQSPEDVAGVWKRLGKSEAYYLITLKDGALTGKLVNPPFESLSCALELSLEGNKLTGQAKWSEKVDDKEYHEGTAWEFTLNGKELKGRAEVIDWEEGKVYSRDWADYTLVRVEPKGLVTQGSAEDAGFGDDLGELARFAGGWAGPGGAWAATVEGDTLTLKAVGHHGDAALSLKNERGTLRGEVTVDGTTSKVELGLNDGKLTGRSSWSAGPATGWSPIAFTRLPRTEMAEGAAAAPDRPAAGEGPLAGVWKRDDGLYLRVREQGGEVKGVLSEKGGAIKARVTFSQKDGVWVGLVNWGSYETTWELAVHGDALEGRAQWADLHDGKLIASGWAARSLSRLKPLD
ncbi:MAG: hypothetical protein AB7N76_18565 [Planctomycetota bacterium]